MLKLLTINDAGYYNSYENDAKSDPTSNPKVATNTSDRKKIKVTDTSNEDLLQKLLINRTLPIITTATDTRIPDRVATCGGTPHARTRPATKEVIMDTARISTHIRRTPGHVNMTGRDGTMPMAGNAVVLGNCPVLIWGTTAPPICVIMGS